MSILVSGQPQTEWSRLTGNTATVIYTADKRTTITAIAASVNAAGTPTLAIWRTKGATDFYLRMAQAVTAGQRVLIDEVLVLDQGDILKAQSNDASGHFDITVTHLAPSALQNR